MYVCQEIRWRLVEVGTAQDKSYSKNRIQLNEFHTALGKSHNKKMCRSWIERFRAS